MADLVFRNLEITPDAPVEEWPLEAIQTALERGSLVHWRRLVKAIQAEPWGRTARGVEEVLTYSRPYGVTALMESIITKARATAAEGEREEVAAEVRSLIESSGLSQAEFASRLGTSASRLSTYAGGRVVPSAALMVRMRNLAARAARLGAEQEAVLAEIPEKRDAQPGAAQSEAIGTAKIRSSSR